MNFNTWKDLFPIQYMAKRLNFDAALAQCNDWDGYTRSFIRANDE